MSSKNQVASIATPIVRLESAPEFLNSAEVCSLLRCSSKTLQRLRQRREINFVRTGGKYLYRSAAVSLFLARREVRAA